MNNRFFHACMTLAVAILFNCARENFLPAVFDMNNSNQNNAIIDKGTLPSNSTGYYINPNQIHRFTLVIDSGYLYSFDLISESHIFGNIFLKKDGIKDSLVLNGMVWGTLESVFAANKRSTLYLDIHSHSSYINRYYTIWYKKQPTNSISNNSYIDTSILDFKLKPVKAVFCDSLSIDSVLQFDHLYRKYRFRIPIDSFEMNEFSASIFHSTFLLSFTLISRHTDSVVFSDTFDHEFLRYWDSNTDSLDLVLGVAFEYENYYTSQLKEFGIVLEPRACASVSTRKTKFPPVSEDPFSSDTASMIFLKKDTSYNLSLYKETSDKFFYITRPDSIYSLSITSPDSLPLSVGLSPMSSDLSVLDKIVGKKEIFLKPSANTTVLGIEISSSISYPTNYTLQFGIYTGNDTIDLFEPDDNVDKASLLVQDSIYPHTIFPMNDIDLFKIPCKGIDTFMIYVDFMDSTLLKNSKFSLYPYFNFDQNALKIHKLSIRDSASYEISTWYRIVADTAFFVAENIQSGDYAISLRRK